MIDSADQTSTDAQESPEQNPDKLALFLRLQGWVQRARDHLSDWRKEAQEDFGFVSGDQWDENDKQMLRDQLRPVITFNRVGPIIDSVAGMEVGNRQEIHYYPREVQDSGKGELLTNAVRFFRNQADTEDEESDAFFDAVVTGLGWTESRPDYDSDPEGELITERLDPLACFYDPAAKKRNLTDRRYCGYLKELTLEDAEEMFPDADPAELHAGWAGLGDETRPHDQAVGPKAYTDRQNTKSGLEGRRKVTVVYVEWWDREAVYSIASPDSGQMIEVPAAKWERLQSRVEGMGLQFKATKRNKKTYYRAFLGATILEYKPGRCATDFTVNCITGKRDRNENTWYGLVRAMKDPQRWANKFFSQILHIINSNAKGGLLAEKTAFDNPRKAEESWADPTAITFLKDGALAAGKVMPKPPAQYPQGLDRLLQFAISSIRDATGVNLELLGMADRQQAGVLEYQRRQAGMTILATMFDALRHYRKVQGRVMLYFVQKYVPPGRLIRIDGDNGPRYAPLVLDQVQTNYDVIVDETPTSPNQKEVVWQTITQMIPFLAKQPIPAEIWAQLLRYSPLPDSVSSKMGQTLIQASQQPPPPDPRVMAMQQELQIKQAEAQMQMQQSAQQHQQDLAINQQQAAQQSQIEQAKAAQQLQIERTKAIAQVMLAEQQAAHQAHMKERDQAAQHEQARAESDHKIRSDQTAFEGMAQALAPVAQALMESARANAEAAQETQKSIKELAAQVGRPKKVKAPSGRTYELQ